MYCSYEYNIHLYLTFISIIMGFYKKRNFETATFGQHRLTCCYFDPYVGSDFNYALCNLMSWLRLIVVVNHKTSSIPKGSTLRG